MVAMVTISYNFDQFDDSKKAAIHKTAVFSQPESPQKDHKHEGTSLTSEQVDLSFFDFLDVINPLQHIPLVNTAYREITGDEIIGPAKVIGGGIFGGLLGLASGIVDAIVEDISGNDISHHVVAALTGDNLKADDNINTDKVNNDIAIAQTDTPVSEQQITQTPLSPNALNNIQTAAHDNVNDDTAINKQNINATDLSNPSIANSFFPASFSPPKSSFNDLIAKLDDHEQAVIEIFARHYIDHNGNRLSQ
jgi:hypothetical protein